MRMIEGTARSMGFTAVSYTHLDVYKRQELSLLLLHLLYGLVGYLGLFAMEGLILFTIIYLIRAKSTSCLLYTSRCV